jgi:putative nucleotidyltransferase with HDIG domain
VANLRIVERTREEAFRALGLALEYRDLETKGHTDRVVALARSLGRHLNLADADMESLAWGAYLHDLGKIAIADAILLKPGKLTPQEFDEVKRHAVLGDEMSRDLAFLPAASREVVRAHHERWDGSGYPDGLAGEEIPFLARLFALVDVYDALVSERPYKRAWTHQEAVEEIVRQSGAHFDPRLAREMVCLLGDGEDPFEMP